LHQSHEIEFEPTVIQPLGAVGVVRITLEVDVRSLGFGTVQTTAWERPVPSSALETVAQAALSAQRDHAADLDDTAPASSSEAGDDDQAVGLLFQQVFP
jgi:hypothetical protein